MSKLPKPISNYIDRFINQYNDLGLAKIDQEGFDNLILNSSSQINNLFMSGLGASTLVLRLGAVIQLAKRLEEGDTDEDALLMKQILENLREILPSDTNWKTVWQICCDVESKWAKCVERNKGNQSLMERFITFRNKYVHDLVSVQIIHSKDLQKGIDIINEICNEASILFDNTDLKEKNGKYYFISEQIELDLYPFVQKGKSDGLPYIFQGLYNNKSTAELISTFHGDIEKQDESNHYDDLFNPMRNLLKGGAGQVFDHRNRIEYYNECFVGRDMQSKEIIKWAKSEDNNNILPIFSQAGMGKGALVANIVTELSKENVPVLHHFCGSGLANNLHAVLYHLILQGKKMQLWKTDDEDLQNKISKLPSKFSDVIMLFHTLLDNCFVPTRKNITGNLIIVIDGLDEASVAFSEYNLSDYFSNYDDNSEVVDSWYSKSNIKWIFTYREGFYQFPKFDSVKSIESVQPLLGLDEASVSSALDSFKPSKEFISTVIERGKITTSKS